MYCTNCGAQLNDGDKFCANCGTMVGSNPQGGFKKPDFFQKANCVSVKSPAKKWWKRLDVDAHVSIGRGILFVVLGIIVCSIGWLVMDASTCYMWMKIRDSEYVQIFGAAAPSFAQWLAFAIGTIINIIGIFYVYRTLSRLADRTNAVFTGNSVSRKILACVICAVIVVCYNAICAAVKPRPSIWDCLIMVALCRIIWRGLARNRGISNNAASDDKVLKATPSVSQDVSHAQCYKNLLGWSVVILCVALCVFGLNHVDNGIQPETSTGVAANAHISHAIKPCPFSDVELDRRISEEEACIQNKNGKVSREEKSCRDDIIDIAKSLKAFHEDTRIIIARKLLVRGYTEDSFGERKYFDANPVAHEFLLDIALTDDGTEAVKILKEKLNARELNGHDIMMAWEEENYNFKDSSAHIIARFKFVQKLGRHLLGVSEEEIVGQD